MGKEKGLSAVQIRSDILSINIGHFRIRQREKYEVSPAYRRGRRCHAHAIAARPDT